MVEIYCDGNCYSDIKQNNNKAEWKVILNKAYRKNYKQKKMYFCSECIVDLLDGTWSGGGVSGSDVKKIIKIRNGKKSKKIKKNRYPHAMRVCQNCRYSDNSRGKWFQDGWNVFCNNYVRFFRWDTRKRCFKKETKEQMKENE